MRTDRLTTDRLVAMKRQGERIAALTAYDYTSAQMLDAAGIPLILVGDTLGMVVQGEETTLSVSLDHVVYHARAVTRGVRRALVVGDLPFMTYHASIGETLHNAARLMREAKVGAVKLEGGADLAPSIEKLVAAGIPVCGHLGFTPQSTHTLGGPRLQGRSVEAPERLIEDAVALQAAGAFALVLELVPTSVADAITRRLRIPTLGIGSGAGCDGEIQVFHDLFGLYTDFEPRHTRRYLNVAEQITSAATRYRGDVLARTFPGPENSGDLKPEVRRAFLGRVEANEALEHLELALRIAGLTARDLALPESRQLHIQGLRFHYLDWGAAGKTPIVFLHGGGLSAHTWDLVCATLRDEYHCLALDQRGHGETEWSADLDYAAETQKRDIEGFVAELGLERFFLVGMSMGGMNALLYAAEHAERLHGLALVDCGPEVQASGGQRILDFVLQTARADSLDDLIAQALAFNPTRDPRLLRRSLLHSFRPDGSGGWVRKNYTRHWRGSDVAERVARLRECWTLVPRIGCPTLVVRGARSDVFRDQDAEQLAARLPDGRWVRVENAGHNVQGDNPGGLLDVLRPFLASRAR